MAENTSEDLVRLLVTQSRSFPETTAHHDNRDRKENPVARKFSLAQPKYDAERLTITLDLCGSTVLLDLP